MSMDLVLMSLASAYMVGYTTGLLISAFRKFTSFI